MTTEQVEELRHHLDMAVTYQRLVQEHVKQAHAILVSMKTESETVGTKWQEFMKFWTGPYY